MELGKGYCPCRKMLALRRKVKNSIPRAFLQLQYFLNRALAPQQKNQPTFRNILGTNLQNIAPMSYKREVTVILRRALCRWFPIGFFLTIGIKVILGKTWIVVTSRREHQTIASPDYWSKCTLQQAKANTTTGAGRKLISERNWRREKPRGFTYSKRVVS